MQRQAQYYRSPFPRTSNRILHPITTSSMVSNEFKAVPPPSSSIGHWLPKDRAYIKKWLATKLEEFDKKESVTLDPSIVALQELVAANSHLTKLSQDMF